MPSSAAEDYLKTIYHLSRNGAAAGTNAIADRLNVAAASVTGMIKRLARNDLVEHVPYYGARLTSGGEAEALRLIRRHRVIELFLVQTLGYTWDRVHQEAERLEHAASDELIDRLASWLGEPEADPHGAPIPLANTPFVEPWHPALSEIEPGREAVVKRVEDEDPAMLRYLSSLGLMPGTTVVVEERAPFDGPIRLRSRGREIQIGVRVAQSLRVEPVTRVDEDKHVRA